MNCSKNKLERHIETGEYIEVNSIKCWIDEAVSGPGDYPFEREELTREIRKFRALLRERVPQIPNIRFDDWWMEVKKRVQQQAQQKKQAAETD